MCHHPTVESTIYSTLNDLKRRKQNLVITGVPELNEDDDDINQAECFFVKTCEQYLSIKLLPLHHGTKRLGKKKTCDNRPRRLLIRLQSEECFTAVLSAAKNLRFSDDEYIRNSVFINADLSPTEAKQAYLRRKRRREQQANAETTAAETIANLPSESTASTEAGGGLSIPLRHNSTNLPGVQLPIITEHYDPEITFKRPITQCECSLGDASASATTGDVKLTDYYYNTYCTR